MALWIDSGSSRYDATSKQLVDLLADVLKDPPRITRALRDTQVDLRDIEQSNTTSLYLASAIPEVRRQLRMRALLEYLKPRYSARTDEFDHFLELDEAVLVLGVRAGEEWRISADPLDAHWVDVGLSQPVFDRIPFRSRLKRLRDEGYSTLNVTGDGDSGKTVTVRLALHMCKVHGIRRAAIWDEDWSADDPLTDVNLATALLSQLGGERTPRERAEHASHLEELVRYVVDPDTRARLLCNEICELIEPPRDEVRWILIDGLEKPQVHPSAVRFVERLILSLNRDFRPSNTKLVVTGFEGRAHRQTLAYRTTPIDRVDVDDFIETVTIGRAPVPSSSRRDEWGTAAMSVYWTSGGDLGALGDHLSEVLERHYRPGTS